MLKSNLIISKFSFISLVIFSFHQPLFSELADRPRNYIDGDHQLFLKGRQECVESLICMVQKGTSFENIMEVTATWRNELAKKQLGQFDGSLFGIKRKTPLVSDLANSGAEYLQEKSDLLLKSGVVQDNIIDSRFDGVKIYKKLFSEEIFEKDYFLTELCHCDQFYPEKYNYLDFIFPIQHLKYAWIHTQADVTYKIIDYLEPIYQDLVCEKNKTKALKKIAEIHWFFSHACPYYRGSAAIAEAISQALLWYKGFYWEKLPHLMIDVEALTEPVKEEFIRVYPKFFRPIKKTPSIDFA